jgi:hypothetical protein
LAGKKSGDTTDTTFKRLFALPRAERNSQNPVPSLIPVDPLFEMYISNFVAFLCDAAVEKAGLSRTARSVAPFGHFLA